MRCVVDVCVLCVQFSARVQVTLDGFYRLSYAAVVVGMVLSLYFARELPALEQVPLQEWHAPSLESSASRKLHQL